MVSLLQRVTLQKRQSNQSALPRLSAPRLGSAFPHSGIAPRAAATARPWPVAAKPASCRFTRSSIPTFGLGLNGAVRSRSTADQEHGGLKADLSVRSKGKVQSESRDAFLWERACSRKT